MRGSRSFSSPGGSRYASTRPGSSDYFPVTKEDARISISSSRSYSRGVTSPPWSSAGRYWKRVEEQNLAQGSNVGGGVASYDAGAVEEACKVLSDESRVLSEVASHLTHFFVGLPYSAGRAAYLFCALLFLCCCSSSPSSSPSPSSSSTPPPLLLHSSSSTASYHHNLLDSPIPRQQTQLQTTHSAMHASGSAQEELGGIIRSLGVMQRTSRDNKLLARCILRQLMLPSLCDYPLSEEGGGDDGLAMSQVFSWEDPNHSL
jgi:hypothetical protein